jgi:hypothetical protein
MDVRGMDASPTDLHDYILQEMRLDVSPNKISSYKSSIRKKAGLEGRRKKKGRAPAEAAVPASVPAAPASEGVSIKELRALKVVADRLGTERFREVVEFLCS